MTQTSQALAIAVVIGLCSAPARADELYVAPTGNDGNSGGLDAPFATVERAQAAAAPGDTVFIRGGVYAFGGTTETVGVSFTKSGTTDNPIRYFAYPGETPIFDLFERKPQQRVTGLDVHCNWIHIRGLEVRGVRQLIVGDSWGVRIRGDHNVIEHLDVHDNEAPGVFITSGSHNLILNCDSHHNYDPLEMGDNADGFGCHSSGEGNVLRGCRAWENSDDGFDFINAAGACTVERSWSFRNGWIPDTNTGIGNGAGFKSGGYGNPPKTPATGAAHHVVRFNVAFGNRAIGFYANYHPGGIDFFNNTAFDNPSSYDMRTPPGVTSSHTLRNNIAAGSGHDIVSFSGGTDDFNAWTLPVTVTNDDFVSLDTTQAYADRKADGSLPSMTLARLRDDSDLIDKGQDLGFPFAGTAPDLGAFEVGLTPVEPMDMDAGMPDGGMNQAGAGGAGGMTAGGAGGVGGGVGGMSSVGGAAGMTGAQPLDAAVMQPQPGGAMAPSTGGAGSVGPAASGTGDTSGCGCRVASSKRSPGVLLSFMGVLLGLRIRRRRRARRRR